MSRVTTQIVIEGKNNSKAAFEEVNKSLQSVDKQLKVAGRALVGFFSVSAMTGAVRSIAAAADNYNLMNARLKLATKSQEEFNTAQTELRKIAASTEAPLSSLVTLYGRISRPLKEAGRSQADILKVTEAVATSFRVSGASAQEAENGVIQFAQALGSGALRGDEFNSVAEQAPRLMQALADGIGVPVSALKEMAKQGELTAEVVTGALIGQLDVLRKESATLPSTVGGAMTALSDRWNEAIGQADVTPLIDAIKQLGDTLSDPVVVDNLVKLASAIASLAGAVVEGGSEFVDLGKRIGFIAANAAGLTTELDQVDQQIADLDRSIAGTGLSTTLDGLLYSEAELKAKRDALVAFRQAIVDEQTGMNEELRQASAAAAAASETERQNELASREKYAGELKKLQDDQVAAAEKAIKAETDAVKAAQKELQNARNAQLETERRYTAALEKLRAGDKQPDKPVTFRDAFIAKGQASQALSAGDAEKAKIKAQEALQILLQLQEAGESTYGFAGIASGLQEIEAAADQINLDKATQSAEAAQVKLDQLKLDFEAMKNTQISPELDQAQLETVHQELQKFAAQMALDLVIPVRLQPTGGAGEEIPGFATGTGNAPPGMAWVGERGPELVMFSGGEQVFTSAASRALASRMSGPELSGMAGGGPSFPSLGSLTLDIGGTQATIYADPAQALDLKRLAAKHGRTQRK